ncbi:hypothetical protein DY000_02057209 [Brassica cretica]|uniref:Cathepsin propeptide inhibitor domain-containing protein n=1 Tax=Brassica cretica TaxID=69181 RepID=A0ABQ7A6A7_BRACR|nr:hypothetical protein DY000_02057209 [Brassica cretica]
MILHSLLLLSFLLVSVSSSPDGDDVVIRQVVDGGAEPNVLSSEDHFTLFKSKFGKVYASGEEHDYRFSVFKANLRRARRHQKMDPSARHGVTQFSDLTRSEFREKHLGVKGGFKLPKDANKAPSRRRRHVAVERFVDDDQQSDARDGVAAGYVRLGERDDFGERVDEGRARDSRDVELRGGVCGFGRVEPGGCDQDESDEYEGGGGENGAV